MNVLKKEIGIDKEARRRFQRSNCERPVSVTRYAENCHTIIFRADAIFPAVISVFVARLCCSAMSRWPV